jgi:hypothetical protein
MDTPAQTFGERHKSMLLATAAWTFWGALLYVAVPLAAPLLLPMCVLAPMAWSWAVGRLAFRPAPAVIVGLAFAGLYFLLNASWSLSPSAAYSAVFGLFIFAAAFYLTLNSLDDTDTDALRSMAIGFHVGMVAAAVLVCFEVLTHQWARRLVMSCVPALRPDPNHMVVEAGWVTLLQPYLINRSIAALALLAWPAVLIINQFAPSRERLAYLLWLLPLPIAVFASQHATSKMALIGSTALFFAFRASPRVGRRIVAMGWILAWLLVVPMAMLAYRSHVHLATWLPFSAKHRIVIWGLTAQEISRAPLFGSGISTGRAASELSFYDVDYVPGTNIPMAMGIHSHNAYLQTWYETGAVGALLLLGIGLLVLRSLDRAAPETQPYLYAAFACCALAGASSFSLWQPWFMASFGFVAAFAALGAVLGERSPPPARWAGIAGYIRGLAGMHRG